MALSLSCIGHVQFKMVVKKQLEFLVEWGKTFQPSLQLGLVWPHHEVKLLTF